MASKTAKDERTIELALGKLMELIEEDVPKLDLYDMESCFAGRKVRIEACKALVPLLERRAKLLGLDTAPEPDTQESAVERMSRTLEAQRARS